MEEEKKFRELTQDEKLKEVSESLDVCIIKITVTKSMAIAIVHSRNDLLFAALPPHLQLVIEQITQSMAQAGDKTAEGLGASSVETLMDENNYLGKDDTLDADELSTD